MTALSALLLLALLMLWMLFARNQARTAINTSDKDTMTTAMMTTENMESMC